MQQHIAVRVAGEAFRVFDAEAANNQGHAGFEGVRVKAVADAHAHFTALNDPTTDEHG